MFLFQHHIYLPYRLPRIKGLNPVIIIIITFSVSHTNQYGNAALQPKFHSFVCLLLILLFCGSDVEK